MSKFLVIAALTVIGTLITIIAGVIAFHSFSFEVNETIIFVAILGRTAAYIEEDIYKIIKERKLWI